MVVGWSIWLRLSGGSWVAFVGDEYGVVTFEVGYLGDEGGGYLYWPISRVGLLYSVGCAGLLHKFSLSLSWSLLRDWGLGEYLVGIVAMSGG